MYQNFQYGAKQLVHLEEYPSVEANEWTPWHRWPENGVHKLGQIVSSTIMSIKVSITINRNPACSFTYFFRDEWLQVRSSLVELNKRRLQNSRIYFWFGALTATSVDDLGIFLQLRRYPSGASNVQLHNDRDRRRCIFQGLCKIIGDPVDII